MIFHNIGKGGEEKSVHFPNYYVQDCLNFSLKLVKNVKTENSAKNCFCVEITSFGAMRQRHMTK